MVFGNNTLGSQTDLHIAKPLPDRFIGYHSAQHVRLFIGAVDADYLFMNDKTLLKRTIILSECLEEEDISRLKWPVFPKFSIQLSIYQICLKASACHQPPRLIPEIREALINWMA
ncbi:hypothetical protein AVEN_183240-1 [Araneus ventricosus]|uniref:Uncharacterized protein n=1 Tax=Araneus ventricosus TaxID=182803 RepID=A0A4Y2MGQ3_ARAVE|nr:hypothetical protein AVEN_183240-1 [Araneus ventricosus]